MSGWFKYFLLCPHLFFYLIIDRQLFYLYSTNPFFAATTTPDPSFPCPSFCYFTSVFSLSLLDYFVLSLSPSLSLYLTSVFCFLTHFQPTTYYNSTTYHIFFDYLLLLPHLRHSLFSLLFCHIASTIAISLSTSYVSHTLPLHLSFLYFVPAYCDNFSHSPLYTSYVSLPPTFTISKKSIIYHTHYSTTIINQ